MTWFLLFFVVLSYEIWAGINHGHHVPMLTQVVVKYLPWPFTLGFIVWLFCHFFVRYFGEKGRQYQIWLRRGGAGG